MQLILILKVMRKSIQLIIVIFGLTNLSLKAQDDGYLRDYTGHATYKYYRFDDDYDYAQKYTSQEEVTIKQKVEAVSKYLQTYKLLSNIKGVEIFLTSLISERALYMSWSNQLYFKLNTSIYPWYMYEGKPVWKCTECASWFSLHFNRLDMVFHGYVFEEVYDKDGIIMNLEPILIGEQDGCKIYQNGVITVTNGKPLWVPVTVKEYNNAMILKSQKKLDEPGQELASKMYIEKVKEEIAAMTEKELNSPAYQGDKFGACPYQLEGARAIVKLNKDYFDKTKPRTATQLIILECGIIQSQDNGDYYFTSEYSTPQAIWLAEILKSLKYSQFNRFLE